MELELVVIARFHYRHQAEIAKGYLDHAGLEAALFIDDAGGMDVGMAFANPGRLMVRTGDRERALRVLRQAGVEVEIG